MKKLRILLSVLFISLLASKANGQTFTQTFIDKCSGEVKVATTNYVNGNAVVSFYNQVRVFSPAEVQSGVLQMWLQTTYAAYSAIGCPTNIVVQQTVQQTVNQAVQQAASAAATQAASQAASSAASSAASTAASNAASSSASSAASGAASSAASSAATPPPTPTTPPPAQSSSTPPPAQSSSSSSSNSSSSSSSETKAETKSETKSESKSETKSESKSEEKKEETKSESKKEEKKEESKKEEKKKEEKKSQNLNPLLLASDLSMVEDIDRNWAAIISTGVSRSSMAGDETYSLNSMVWSNLKQFALSGGYTKMNFKDGALKSINSYSLTGAYLAGNYMGLVGATVIIPHPKFGTYGYNVGIVNLFIDAGSGMEYSMSSSGLVFWTKPYPVSQKLTISPQIFTMFAPISWNSVAGTSTINKNMGYLIGSSFDYKLSKRFGLSINYKLSGNTAAGSPFLSNVLIGSRMIL